MSWVQSNKRHGAILQKVDKLKFICLKYATATQWLIPAIFRQNDHFQQSGPTDKRSKKGYKERRGRLEYPMQARQAAEDSNFKLTIGYYPVFLYISVLLNK